MNARPIPLALLLLFSACSDILEKDLTGYGVVLVTPPDGYSTSANVITFRWEAVPNANHYRFQLATPDFINPVLVLTDTLTTAASFEMPVSPGNYRWRVRAENPNSHTDYYERSVVVTEAASLDGLTPILLAPAQNAATWQEPLLFSWSALSGADDYRFELREGSQSGAVVQASIFTATTASLTGIAEGNYAWGVQAQNATSSSSFSYRSLRIDRTAPSVPVLLAPSASASIEQAPFTFQWQSGADALTAVTDSLLVRDSNEQLIRSFAVSNGSYPDSLGTGTYTWHVRSTDEAGNGTSSAVRTFTVQ